MKTSRLLLLITLLAVLFSLSSCQFTGAKSSAVSPRMTKLSAKGFNVSESAVADFAPNLNYAEANLPTDFQRKIVMDGYLNIEVKDLAIAENQMLQLLQTSGGWLSDSSRYDKTYSATIKVPAEHFDQLMHSASDFGKVLQQSVSSYDITDTWYDVETRLETKRTLQKKLQGYLSEASNLSDLLEIENQLSNVTSDLEIMEGQMQRMANQVAYSTIHLNFNLPGEYNDGSFWSGLKSAFTNFVPNLLRFLAWCGLALLYLAVFGIPAVAIMALLFWLLFGKIGLLRKLFLYLK